MSEMVRRVAEAIRKTDDAVAPFGMLRDGEDDRAIARAALTAMREPTRKMICAVLDAHDRNPRRTIADDWQTMIDAALAD